MRRIPNQKPGTDRNTSDPTSRARSSDEPWRVAAMTPSPRPRSVPRPRPASASAIVYGNRCARIAATGVPDCHDSPRLPRTASTRNPASCVSTGRSKPSRWCTSRSTATLSALPPYRAWAGSPPMRRIMANVRTATPTQTGTNSAMRRSAYTRRDHPTGRTGVAAPRARVMRGRAVSGGGGSGAPGRAGCAGSRAGWPRRPRGARPAPSLVDVRVLDEELSRGVVQHHPVEPALDDAAVHLRREHGPWDVFHELRLDALHELTPHRRRHGRLVEMHQIVEPGVVVPGVIQRAARLQDEPQHQAGIRVPGIARHRYVVISGPKPGERRRHLVRGDGRRDPDLLQLGLDQLGEIRERLIRAGDEPQRHGTPGLLQRAPLVAEPRLREQLARALRIVPVGVLRPLPVAGEQGAERSPVRHPVAVVGAGDDRAAVHGVVYGLPYPEILKHRVMEIHLHVVDAGTDRLEKMVLGILGKFVPMLRGHVQQPRKRPGFERRHLRR